MFAWLAAVFESSGFVPGQAWAVEKQAMWRLWRVAFSDWAPVRWVCAPGAFLSAWLSRHGAIAKGFRLVWIAGILGGVGFYGPGAIASLSPVLAPGLVGWFAVVGIAFAGAHSGRPACAAIRSFARSSARSFWRSWRRSIGPRPAWCSITSTGSMCGRPRCGARSKKSGARAVICAGRRCETWPRLRSRDAPDRRHLSVRPARADRISGPRIPPQRTDALFNKDSIGTSLAHDEGFTRRERGFMRESAPTFNDLRWARASAPLLEVGSSRSGLRTGSAPVQAQASPPAPEESSIDPVAAGGRPGRTRAAVAAALAPSGQNLDQVGGISAPPR